MSTNWEAGSAALPLALERRVDAACRRFEAAWREGARPRLEDYLAEGPEPARPALLAELLALELDYRVRAGEAPAAGEYHPRFPGHDALVAEAFRSLDLSTVPHPPVPEQATVPGQEPGRAGDGPPDMPGYEVLGRLGEGGMAVVWRGRDLRLRRDVAVKVLKAGLAGEPQLARRFLGEAQVASQLAHPAIPPVHELGELPDGRPYFVMKLVQGRTLAELLRARSGPAEELPRWLAAFEQVCQAVAYAHSKGVLHRDLKPANVMVGSFGEVQVSWPRRWRPRRRRPRRRTRRAAWWRRCGRGPRTTPRRRGRCWGRRPTWHRSRRAARSSGWTGGPTCSGWGRCCARC
jgi:hypothetical protein